MFDPSLAHERIRRLWKLTADFGTERGINRLLLDEIVSDRMQLLSGLQVPRDELQFAIPPAINDREACTADFSKPSVVTTLAFTNCGDRVHQGEIDNYRRVVGSRFATLSEMGTLKPESFSPTGGGTDDGATLAHVTWSHALDDLLRTRIYDGHEASFVLAAFDLKTHVGRLDDRDNVTFGMTRESPWRQPRAACGAIAGTLARYTEDNAVHRRIRADLGEPNFQLLRDEGVKTADGVDITAVVAAAIVAIRGMLSTARALETEMDERGVAHLTASMTVNRPSMPDTAIYLARATVFGGELVVQGFGTDATKYSGLLKDTRLRLTYQGQGGPEMSSERYVIPSRSQPIDPFC